MWRMVVFVAVILWTGGGTGEAAGRATEGAKGRAVEGATGRANDNPNINCILYLHNPDRCIFFIGLNSTSSNYYAKYKETLDMVTKICEGNHILNGTSVTSSLVKVQHTDELQQIAEKYPLSNAKEYYVLAVISNGTSSGGVNDYAVYNLLKEQSNIYLSNDTSMGKQLLTWISFPLIPLKYIACQVDLTPAGTPKQDRGPRLAKAEEPGSQAVDEEPAEPDDEVSDGTYAFFFEPLPPQANAIPSNLYIDCKNDAKIVGSKFTATIGDANCKSELKALGITGANGADSDSIKLSFKATKEVLSWCAKPQLEFIGVDRNTINYAFRCQLPRPWWPTVVMAALSGLIVSVSCLGGWTIWRDFHPFRPDNVEEVVDL